MTDQDKARMMGFTNLEDYYAWKGMNKGLNPWDYEFVDPPGHQPRIKFKTKDGTCSVAENVHMALCHWFMRYLPDVPLPADVQPFVVYQGNPIPGSGDPKKLLDACIACCERNWAKTPELDGETVEDRQWSLLGWLRGRGEIVGLRVDGVEQ